MGGLQAQPEDETWRDGYATFQARWLNSRGVRWEWLGSLEFARSGRGGRAPVRHCKRHGEIYDAKNCGKQPRMLGRTLNGGTSRPLCLSNSTRLKLQDCNM